MLAGGCQCGAVRYEAHGDTSDHALCHCADCRASAGAPAVAWLTVASADFRIVRGKPTVFNSSGQSFRTFCPVCGTGLTYVNEEVQPGVVDIQSATLDQAAELAPEAHIQTAERLAYMACLNDLPEFARFPDG